MGGSTLLNHYNGSLMKCLMKVYPEYDWKIWKFEKVPQKFWSEIKNQREFFDYLGKKLNIMNWEDWYKVSAHLIRENGGSGLIDLYGMHSVTRAYPEHKWKYWKFIRVESGKSLIIFN